MVVTLTSVYKGDDFYENTVRMFHQNWDTNRGPHPHVSHVFKVAHIYDMAAQHEVVHNQYAATVGNVQYLFHGTRRMCRMGDHMQWTTPCDHPNCSLCGILKCSFDFNRAGSMHGKMFGNGVYTTSVSSKAAQYCESYSKSFVMLLSKVVVGNTALMLQAAPALTAPPCGYHSVTGATRWQGGALDYPETVVYHPAAICVAGIVVFNY